LEVVPLKESKFYNIIRKYGENNKEMFLKKVEVIRNGRMLDVGCGDGSLTKKIGSKMGTKDIYGIENDDKLIREARRKGIKIFKADANKKLPFRNDFFDVIVSNQVLEHLQNTDNFFREMRRLLKPCGYALLSTNNISSINNIFLLLLGKQPTCFNVSEIQVGNFLKGTKVDMPHLKAFTIPALKDLAEYHGFKVERTFGCGFFVVPLKISKLLSSIVPQYAIFIGIKIRKEIK